MSNQVEYEKAFNEGREKPYRQNPYPKDSEQYRAFEEGRKSSKKGSLNG